jgi:hypothetical protein
MYTHKNPSNMCACVRILCDLDPCIDYVHTYMHAYILNNLTCIHVRRSTAPITTSLAIQITYTHMHTYTHTQKSHMLVCTQIYSSNHDIISNPDNLEVNRLVRLGPLYRVRDGESYVSIAVKLGV